MNYVSMLLFVICYALSIMLQCSRNPVPMNKSIHYRVVSKCAIKRSIPLAIIIKLYMIYIFQFRPLSKGVTHIEELNITHTEIDCYLTLIGLLICQNTRVKTRCINAFIISTQDIIRCTNCMLMKQVG